MSRSEPLYRLQILDTELDQTTRSLREVEEALASNAAVAHARAELDTAEKVLRTASARVRALELDMKGAEDKLRENDERLYSGSVRSPKELLDLQRDVDMLRRQASELSESLLAAMLEVDEAQSYVGRCTEALDEAMRSWEGDSVALRRQQVDLNDRISGDLERRNAILPAIPPADLSLYNALRAKKGNNVAVAPVKGKACGVCGESPSSMELQQARGDALVLCPNCGRILFGG